MQSRAYVKSKKAELRPREYIGGDQGLGCGKWDNAGQRIQTSSFKMNKFWESNVQRGGLLTIL